MLLSAVVNRVRGHLEALQQGWALRILRDKHEADWLRLNERLTLEAFRRSARRVPAYRRLLAQRGVEAAGIITLGDFRTRIPLLDKATVFLDDDLADWCLDGDLSGLTSFLTSSGHSGVFSYGVNTEENLRQSARSIDLGLEAYCDTSRYRTLVVNALPMGVKISTRLPIAETSVRADMALAVIRKFVPPFEQVVVLGEGAFLKKLAEDGARDGIDWARRRTHWIAGEEGIAENWRSYMAQLTHVQIGSATQPLIGSSMGIAELDLNLFHETPQTIQIRRWAHVDPKLRAALFGPEARVCPMFFVSYPHRTFLETLPAPGEATEAPGELVVSMLSPALKLPLLRYRTGDLARLFRFSDVARVLNEHGHRLDPGPELPFVAVYGRQKALLIGRHVVTPEMVKEGLYAQADIASRLTANFHMAIDGEELRLTFQLRAGDEPNDLQSAALHEEIARYVPPVPFSVTLMPYASFPWNMGIDYERKFDYLRSIS